ncbi:MAG: type II toxin-antitoxin system HicA family toxin [Nitrospirae bacterium]|nr:type II toxin-antitoxin system HicA family toxin [Magnetococcales bacterium]HAT50643.1 addiction module toxin, HicA family [Alphaproteobacteria bacterium]
MSSREVIRILEQDGRIRHHQRGSHCQFKHPTKPGKVTVPHPRHDMAIGTLNSIWKQAGIKL